MLKFFLAILNFEGKFFKFLIFSISTVSPCHHPFVYGQFRPAYQLCQLCPFAYTDIHNCGIGQNAITKGKIFYISLNLFKNGNNRRWVGRQLNIAD
jgi:hypothetical protein